MSIVLLPLIFAAVAADQSNDPALNQLPNFSNQAKDPMGILTTSAGAPVDYGDTMTLNKNLLCNDFFVDTIMSLARERIPERVVHALGTGAFGYFETTNNISHICKAKVFSKNGKKTPVAVRFSLTGPRIGGSDTSRGTRGFAIKFYTDDGNFDIIGFNLPIFAFRNPLLVMALSRILKTNPVTNLPDPNMQWDFATLNPETLFVNMYSLSDYGMPASYTDMTGHAVHTYQVYNEAGVSSYVRFHLIPVGGAKYLNLTEALKLATNPTYYAKGLYNTIAAGKYPSWDLKVQKLSENDRKNADMDIFDVTKILPEDKYPLHPVGKLTLDRNPSNFFADVEQLGFCPSNVVPGIMGAPDKIFESRRLAYKDSQNYRLGSNSKKIPVNCPINGATPNYIRDGVPPVNDNSGGAPNYYPNSFMGPVPWREKNRPELINIYEKENGNSPANFGQAANFYSNVLTDSQRSSLGNILVATLCPTADVIKNRAVKWFSMINADLGGRVSKGLANCPH